ncbi:hypothetical protein BH09BAC3_BH09BAC3_38150 [soil metagenome]
MLATYSQPKTTRRTTRCEPFLWTWSTSSDENPVKIRVTHNRKRKYYPVKFKGKNLFLSPQNWDNVQDHSLRLRGEMKEIRTVVTTATSLAESAIVLSSQNGRPFTFEKFEKEYYGYESSRGFLKLFQTHLQGIYEEDRIGTFRAYNNSYQAFKKFRKDKDIDPVDLTPTLLKDFESWLLKQEKTKSTIGMYMRAIKVVCNVAISLNPSLSEFYPFARARAEKYKYKIKQGSGKKGDALSMDQLKKFISIPLDKSHAKYEARELWLFSFYAQGMNFRDIALLTPQNINDGIITYVRAKTKSTEGREEKLHVPLNKALLEILTNVGETKGKYVFSILKENMTAAREDAAIRQKIKIMNIPEWSVLAFR